MNELQIFNYKENEVRTIEKDGITWWVLKDICEVLDVKNVTQTAQRLDEDERSMFNLGRQGKVNIVNESGLYSVILRSDKEEAKPFRKWITSEVLPTIRKAGYYELQGRFSKNDYMEILKIASSSFCKETVYYIPSILQKMGFSSVNNNDLKFEIKDVEHDYKVEEFLQNSNVLSRPTKDVYMEYENFCMEHNITPMSKISFSKAVNRILKMKVVDKTIKGKKYRIFVSACTKTGGGLH